MEAQNEKIYAKKEGIETTFSFYFCDKLMVAEAAAENVQVFFFFLLNM